MDIRVTPQTLVRRAISDARRNFSRLANLQQQAATGKRLLAPSDGPLDMVTVQTNKTRDIRLETYVQNIGRGRSVLGVSNSAVLDANQIMSRARVLALEANNGFHDTVSLEAIAQEVDVLITRLLDTANTQQDGRYLFGGTASQAAPFVVTAADSSGRPLSIQYVGSQEHGEVAVSQGKTISVLYPGSDVFQQRDRQVTAYTGNTGAAPGTGTDSATGQGTLIVQHTATTYAPGSGVQPGTSSVQADTIIGPAGAHSLTINDTSGTGAAGTVSLNGGPALAFANTDTDLKVVGPDGEAVFLNMTAILPGFNGTVAITADGTLSVDGGASSLTIDYTGNQVVMNSQDGAVTNVDSSNIRRAGVEQLDYMGSYDAFQTLMALRDTLRNIGGLTTAEQSQALSLRLEEIDRVRVGVLSVVGEQGTALQEFDALETHLQETQLEIRKWTEELEGADLSEVILNLQAQTNQLEVSLSSAARVLDQSLFDFIQ